MILGRRKNQDAGFLRRHSLTLILTVILFGQFVIYTYFAWRHFTDDQVAHGQTATFASFATYWIAETQLSMLADTFGALLLVLATKYFYETGSAESNDPDAES